MFYRLRLLEKNLPRRAAPRCAALGERELERARGRPEHKVYLSAVADRIAFAGPLTHDDGVPMIGSLLAIDFATHEAAHAWLADEPFTRAGLYVGVEVHAFVTPVAAGRRLSPGACSLKPKTIIKHIVMWSVRGDDAAPRQHNAALLKTEFELLRGRVPGLLHLEIGVDVSRVDYACDVVP